MKRYCLNYSTPSIEELEMETETCFAASTDDEGYYNESGSAGDIEDVIWGGF